MPRHARSSFRSVLAFVLALVVSLATRPPVVEAQVAARRIIHQGTDWLVMSATGPDGNGMTIQVYFKAGGQPNRGGYRTVATFDDPDSESDLHEENRADGSEPPLNSFTRTTHGTADEFVFGSAITAKQTERQLCALLAEKVATIDRMCKLTDVQKRKIELAGRGDVARLMDRVERLKRKFDQFNRSPTVEQIQDWATEMAADRERLRLPLESAAFGEGTLFAKVLNTVLTPEQTAAFDRRLLNSVAPNPPERIGNLRLDAF